MKIAVELSGHLRTFEYCAPLLKRYLLDRYDCDVFIHTWDKLEHQSLTWHSRMGSSDEASPPPPPLLDEEVKKKVTDLYQPTAIKIESEETMKKVEGFLMVPRPRTSRMERFGDNNGRGPSDGFGGFPLQAVWNTLYTEAKSHEMVREHEKANGMKYDYVIRTRPDIGLLEPFVIDPFLPFFKMEENSVVFFPQWIYTTTAFDKLISKDYEHFLPSSMDVFYLTTPLAMDKLMSIMSPDVFHKSFVDAPSHFLTPDWQTRWGVELLFLWHTQRMGVMHHFGKINRITKRALAENDQVVVFKDRFENSREHLAGK